METISLIEPALAFGAAAAYSIALIQIGRLLGRPGFRSGGFVPKEEGEVVHLTNGSLDLADSTTRLRLHRMLQNYGIAGDANIRRGYVTQPVPLDRLHPVFTKFVAARRVLDRVQNRNACSLYIRDSVNDRFTIVPELDLDDLMEATEVLRALVAEKQKKGTE